MKVDPQNGWYLKRFAALQFEGSVDNFGTNMPIHVLEQQLPKEDTMKLDDAVIEGQEIDYSRFYVAYEIDTRGPINMKDLIGNMLTDSEHKGELKGTVDCVVNLIRSTKGNTNLNDALEMLKVPADIRDAVAEQAKSILAE